MRAKVLLIGFELHAFGVATRGVSAVDDRQDDVVLVQHLVVLQAVEERRRRAGRIAGQEDRRARNVRRRLLFQIPDQVEKRHLQTTGLFEQDARAPPPGQHDDHQARSRERPAPSRPRRS